MKILVVIDKLSMDGITPSCIAMHLRDSYELFRRRNCQPEICNIRGDDPGSRLLEAAGIQVHKLGLSPLSPLICRRLAGIIDNCGSELVHAHGYSAANFGRLAAAMRKIPAVVHEHAILPVRPHQFLADALLRGLTTCAVGVSGAVADFLVRGRCVPRSRVRVVHNGIDLVRFRQVEASMNAARARFDLPPDVPLAGCAARFRKEKGQHVLLDALPLLHESIPDCHLVLAGDGPDRQLLEQRAAELKVAGKVRFAGFIDDIPLFLRALSVLVIPSLSEGFSFAAAEAMAAGCPVVASRVGGLPEVVEDGVTGLLVPPGDAPALAAAAGKLLTDESLREKLTERAGQDVARFSLETYVDKMTALFGELVHSSVDQN